MTNLRRTLVVGTSCCGKTTFGRALAVALETTHVELDAIYWLPDWVVKPHPEFRRDVERAAAGDRWVIDGNYRSVRDLLWPRATSVIWLNFGFATIWGRACARTLRRTISRERLFAGNRESMGRALFHKDSILIWVLHTFARRRRDFRELRAGGAFPHLEWIELRSPREAEAFLRTLIEAQGSAA